MTTTVLTDINRKARKEHKCCECRRMIIRGEVYSYQSGVHEGEMFNTKLCDFCSFAWVEAFRLKILSDMDHVSVGELRDYLGDEITVIEDKWEDRVLE